MAGFIYGNIDLPTIHHAMSEKELVKQKAIEWAKLIQVNKRPIYWKCPEARSLTVTWTPIVKGEEVIAVEELKWFLEVVNEVCGSTLRLTDSLTIEENLVKRYDVAERHQANLNELPLSYSM